MSWSRAKRRARRLAKPTGPTRQGPPTTPQWRCISGCGSCCRLDPALRPEALEALSPDQQRAYLELVGPDGWCRHYDTGAQRCRIYASRPDFCRIEALITLFGEATGSAPPLDGQALAIACCKQQIRCESGGRGRVMRRFLQAIRRP